MLAGIRTENKVSRADDTSWFLRPQIEIEKEERFSADALIDAYFKGKRDQVEESKKVLFETFADNLNTAKKACEEFFAMLAQKGINGDFVSLKTDSITVFNAIFVVPAQKFLTHDFEAVYKMAREKKKELTTPTFNLTLSFMPLTDSLDEEQMLMDGYILKYGKT
jgi:hypothetical protein